MAAHKAPAPVLALLRNKTKYRSKYQNNKPLIEALRQTNLYKWKNVPAIFDQGGKP